jgi:hypothetical protein
MPRSASVALLNVVIFQIFNYLSVPLSIGAKKESARQVVLFPGCSLGNHILVVHRIGASQVLGLVLFVYEGIVVSYGSATMYNDLDLIFESLVIILHIAVLVLSCQIEFSQRLMKDMINILLIGELEHPILDAL